MEMFNNSLQLECDKEDVKMLRKHIERKGYTMKPVKKYENYYTRRIVELWGESMLNDKVTQIRYFRHLAGAYHKLELKRFEARK